MHFLYKLSIELRIADEVVTKCLLCKIQKSKVMSCKQVLDDGKHQAEMVRAYRHIYRQHILHTERKFFLLYLAITTVQCVDSIWVNNLSFLTDLHRVRQG